MSTLNAPDLARQIHEKAAVGFQAGSAAYERGRPDYPSAAVDHMVNILELSAGKTAIDLGAGTGKFTRMLAEATDAQLIGVEPVEAMREKFRCVLPLVELIDGSAESMPFNAASADAVVVAQAFHWFDGAKALAEIYRVLKPGGRLGLIWNVREIATAWDGEISRIIEEQQSDAPRFKTKNWRDAFDHSALFSPLQYAEFKYVHDCTPAEVVDRVGSISFISALPTDRHAEVLRDVRHLIATHPETAERDRINMAYRTDVYWCSRL